MANSIRNIQVFDNDDPPNYRGGLRCVNRPGLSQHQNNKRSKNHMRKTAQTIIVTYEIGCWAMEK